MITQDDVKLADSVSEKEKIIKALQWESLKIQKEEEERREAFNLKFYGDLGKLRAAERELEKAAEARHRIFLEVPRDLRVAAEQAAAAVRVHQESVEDARRDAEGAEAVLASRREDAVESGIPLERGELEVRQERIDSAKKRHREAVTMKTALEQKAAAAQAAVDLEVVRLRKAAAKPAPR